MWKPLFLCSLLGIVLVAAAFASPAVLAQIDPADLVTRQTARVAILFWGIAAMSLIVRQRDWARAAWTIGCLTFLIHVATAFDRVHGWSHLAALQHVQDVSGFGPGLFVSYAFTLIWIGDVGWWWADRASYDSRPRWLDLVIHLFFAFVVFNGTVVYETGFIRWAGILLFIILGMLFARRRLRQL
ncbi:MAG TPA: hypothetical protein VHR66_13790 [Gemmataceae bacterium]|jgi:cell division protein FtsW (lipid II flippase)|nr:hypothetical protein [Gemmataceae bacterium]